MVQGDLDVIYYFDGRQGCKKVPRRRPIALSDIACGLALQPWLRESQIDAGPLFRAILPDVLGYGNHHTNTHLKLFSASGRLSRQSQFGQMSG
jgi:hypothetical protein